MTYDSSHEEAVVHDLSSFFYFRRSQVQMQTVVVGLHCFQAEVTHAVQLELESQSRFQVPVYSILLELQHKKQISLPCTLRRRS